MAAKHGAWTGKLRFSNFLPKSQKQSLLWSGSFKGITKKTVVKVPKGKVKAYKKLLQSKGLDKKVKVK